MTRFDQQAAVDLPPGTELRRDRPAELPTDDGFRTPAAYALACGIVVYVLACDWMPDDGKLAFGAVGLVLMLGLTVYMVQRIPGVARTVETVTRMDINGDEHIGLPPPPEIVVRTVSEDGNRHTIDRLPGTTEYMARQLLAKRKTLAFNQWEGCTAVTRDQLASFRTWGLKRGYWVDGGGNKGLVITDAGWQALGELANRETLE